MKTIKKDYKAGLRITNAVVLMAEVTENGSFSWRQQGTLKVSALGGDQERLTVFTKDNYGRKKREWGRGILTPTKL